MATILIISRDAAFHEALRDTLRELGGHECIRAATGAQGITLFREARPDLVVIAWSLPDGRGLEICEDLLSERELPVIFVADEADEESRVRGFLAGATDFVVGPLSIREIALRVRAVLRRPVGPAQREIVIGTLRVERASRRAWIAGQEIKLTRVELDLLLALHDGGRRASSRKELRRRVWGRESTIELHSVDSHMKRLRHKLGEAGRCIETVRNVGYRLAQDPPEGGKP